MATNYGLIDTMASGVREGLLAYQQKKQGDQQAQMMQLAYGIQPGADGRLEYTPEKQQELSAQRELNTKKNEAELSSYDPESDVSKQAGLLYEKAGVKGAGQGHYSLAQMKELGLPTLAGKEISGQYGLYGHQMTNDQRSQYQGERIHNQNVKDVVNDPMVNSLITTSSNLNNAISNFKQGGATPQELDELQQSVRSNLGIKGNSGVSERGNTYLTSLGIDKDRFLQKFTGNLQDTMKSDPQFANVVLKIADNERQNKLAQAKAQMSKKAAAHKSFYNQPGNEGRKADLQDAIDQQLGQMGQGLIQAPQPATQAHPQDEAALTWAKSNPNDPRAIKIMQMNGAK